MRKLLFICVAAGSAAALSSCATSGSMSKVDKELARGEYETAIPLLKADIAKWADVAKRSGAKID